MHAGKQAKDTDSQAGRQTHGQALATNKKEKKKREQTTFIFLLFRFSSSLFFLLEKNAVAGRRRSLRVAMGWGQALQEIANYNEDIDPVCTYCGKAASTVDHIKWECEPL